MAMVMHHGGEIEGGERETERACCGGIICPNRSFGRRDLRGGKGGSQPHL